MRPRLMSTLTICLCALSLVLAACGGSTGSKTSQSTAPHAGGSLTVLEGTGFAGDWPAGLDPATDINGAANQSYMNAIFGQLFELGPGGKIVYDLASGATPSNGGKTWTISIRQGVKFQDGSPLNAQEVAWNINRDLASPCTCSPKSFWPPGVKVAATGPYTVQVSLAIPDGAFIDQFLDSNANWIASQQSYNQMGAKAFALKPVGAGPFSVVSDTLSSQLTLKKNPGYWQPGRPYLNSLTFKSVGSDEAAYEAMLAGQGQVYEDMSTPQLLSAAANHFNVVNQQGTSPYDLQLNTATPPFNDIRAREAIYYATNFSPILSKVFHNLYPVVQGFTGPGGLCYQATVPGYRTYDLAKAKALVKQLGGLTVNLGTISNLVAEETTEALQAEWKAAGINATIHNYDLASLIQVFTGKKWQAMIQTAGSYDPAAGVGVGFRFSSLSPFSGVHDPHLDAQLNQAEGALSLSTRCSLYHQAQQYISQQAYGPFYFSFAPANIMMHGVSGPGLSTPLPSTVVTPTILWEDVSA
jgi:peptide/nickel transport system substrate-binding protein